MGYNSHLLQARRFHLKISFTKAVEILKLIQGNVIAILHRVKNIGVTDFMDDYEKSKLGIFNHLNFFQILTGLVVVFIGIFQHKIPVIGWLMACLPPTASIFVLYLNRRFKYQEALIVYFIFYPVLTCFSYINGIDFGIELSFILYGILAVFFIKDIGYMLFSIGCSMISFFILAVVLTRYPYQLEHLNFVAYLFNQGIAIIYIFYGLFLIKKENANYQANILVKNTELQAYNEEIQKQSQELKQLNSLKNKLFSVISHDLKAPMYALRNLFDDIQKQNMPAEDVKALIPDIKNDLNYTVGLMDNLLQWSKSQMQASTVHPQVVHISEEIDDVIHVLCLQAQAKKIRIENQSKPGATAWADKDMINLVIRNLVSNAIKYSRTDIVPLIRFRCSREMAKEGVYYRILIEDNGIGFSQDQADRIFELFRRLDTGRSYTGTGIGLAICKKIVKNHGGTIEARGIQGSGASFEIRIPER